MSEVTNETRDVFILGAGTSKCVGLPLWDELKELILEKISDQSVIENLSEKYHEERFDELRDLIEKVGKEKGQYATVDEGMSIETNNGGSEYYEETQNLFFEIIKQIFEEKFDESGKDDHIASILIKIFLNKHKMEYRNLRLFLGNKIFIDFNYDDVFSKLFKAKIFKTAKDANLFSIAKKFAKRGKSINREQEMSQIEHVVNGTKNLFKPYGCFNNGQPFLVNSETYKNHLREGKCGNNCVPCFDADKDELCFAVIDEVLTIPYWDTFGRRHPIGSINLYILGVGPNSLSYNIGKINFPEDIPINEIVYTCYEHGKENIYEEFLKEKFGENVNLKCIKSCEDLEDVYSFSEEI